MHLHPTIAKALALIVLVLVACRFGAADGDNGKPMRVVVPFGIGTPPEVLSRAVAEAMSRNLGQAVLVEARPGASGAVGAVEVLKQPADGGTVLQISMPLAVGQSIYKDVPFKLTTDFAPVAQLGAIYTVLVTHPSLSVVSVAQFEALLKRSRGQLSFASGGYGTPAHIAGELFKLRTSTEATHVPYNQFPQAIVDLLSGEVQFMFAATPAVMGHVQAGKLKALAVTSAERLPGLKSTPTMVEAGYSDFVVKDWIGIVAKRGTPVPVIDRINAAIARALATDEVKALYAKLGVEIVSGRPEAFGALVESEVARWSNVARAAKIRVD